MYEILNEQCLKSELPIYALFHRRQCKHKCLGLYLFPLTLVRCHLSVPLHCGSLLNSSAEGRLYEQCFFLAFVYFKEIVKTCGYLHKFDTKLSQFVALLAQVSHASV